MVFNIAAEQTDDGSWRLDGGLGLARPPIEEGDITRTGMALRSIQLYGAPGRKAEFQSRIDRARKWLLAATPRTAEDRNMRLLGLHWAGTEPELLREFAKPVLTAQHADGGWGQNPNLPSDAYATGQTLYALYHAAGMSASDEAFRHGVHYLLTTQGEDGSWHVRSRAPKFQPYFESGFPYGQDQWISSAGTGWASMALSLAARE
jgi:N-acyl-D-amino-acid deacylase